MNDTDLEDFGVIALSEPCSFVREGKVLTAPLGHPHWTKMIPTETREGRRVIGSMLWIRKGIESEPVPVPSPDITAALLHLPDRSVFIASVYVVPANPQALAETIQLLRQSVDTARRRVTRERMDILLTGDFNQHDQLWGGDDISPARQGEADGLVDFMNDSALRSLLPRGTKTWQNGKHESTIDLVLASEELAAALVRCRIYGTEHGSDHHAIETTINVDMPEHIVQPRLLLKNAPWKEICAKITSTLQPLAVNIYGHVLVDVQTQADQLMSAVLAAVHALTPVAKPSPYAKRWWTHDLTKLRQIYTRWRNRARSYRRAGTYSEQLEKQTRIASKEYHDAVRQQQRRHWEEFLDDTNNIWQAAKYMKADTSLGSSQIPPLTRRDGSITSGKGEQATELLSTFFPPLPPVIEDEGQRKQRRPVHMPPLTMDEVERSVFAAQSWKAAGEDGLPAVAWKRVWPAVKERVLTLFRTSLREGILPAQWKTAKIIPLKKPNKSDYTAAKAWRPISLLATLGKALEAVVAERISHAVETAGLLPTNHFGARKRRSAVQAILLLQEHIYKAWRNRRVLSLISFDVKGAYNGVCKERLLQRLQARGIPATLVKWIDSFCSDRSATIVVNGQASERQALQQAGLPQGSPLSPVLFLFFNADLVQRKIDSNGGAIAFVDDYTAWVTGPSAEANQGRIQAVVDQAIEWEQRSGATFEGDKTAFIHFTRIPCRSSVRPVLVKGQEVEPVTSTKILGVVVDSELRFQQHIARAATAGLTAAMALKRLRGLSPSTARRLFETMVAPVVDYASPVWMYKCKGRLAAAVNRVQRIGAQAVTGCFRTVAREVAEAEASMRTVQQRHAAKAASTWVDILSLPTTNPLSKLRVIPTRRFRSPLQQMSTTYKVSTRGMESIAPYTVAPWHRRLAADAKETTEEAVNAAKQSAGICVATSSSARNNIVGAGVAIQDTERGEPPSTVVSTTVSARTEHNPYTAALIALAEGLAQIPLSTVSRNIYLFSDNRAALQAVCRPRQQSGQETIQQIYKSAWALQGHNTVRLAWCPTPEFELGQKAKEAAKAATEPGQIPQSTRPAARSTAISHLKAETRKRRQPIEGVGKHIRRIDTAIPGPHTRMVYDRLGSKQASVLAQLRTGMSRLNGYLHRIGAAESDLCACTQATETVEHFLFRCRLWDDLRLQMLQHTDTMRGNLSFFLGGKAASDNEKWKPAIDAVLATIQFAMATGRLESSSYQPSPSQVTANRDT
ncbi:hypothetical protein CKM354_000217300 [Cercospora kikuchii]|uniref:Reverse transcriptase domain-containing protein n=2 Tax=Cercospora kikuchii TaxID=84275 RepID=A0A9P3C9P0_9PEZI|nr:uncharacterized protein CKM354_000217300 [Cercospora kikuchii]GIZ38771.1 hypothetical protein CKM354_000217300 [Cercospora kikuchii]